MTRAAPGPGRGRARDLSFLLQVALALCLAVALPTPGAAQFRRPETGESRQAAVAEIAEALAPGRSAQPLREEAPLPHWRVVADGEAIAVIGSSWEISATTGYSGKPIDVAVAVDLREGRRGRIAAVRLVSHEEPILTLGLSSEDLARFTEKFVGFDLASDTAHRLPDVKISRATVTSGVLRDAILGTARTLAVSSGALPGAGIDRTDYRPLSWDGILAAGGLVHGRLSYAEARAQLAEAKVPPPEGEGTFIEVWAGLADPPSVGRNLLGEHAYQRAIATLAPGQSLLFVASRGLVGHRGTAWRRTGVFDTVTIVQDGRRLHPQQDDFIPVERVAAQGAPKIEQASLFRMPAEGFDPTLPFTVEIAISRPARGGGTTAARLALNYRLPEEWTVAPPPPPPPAWQDAWEERMPEVFGVAVLLAILFLILLFQTSIVRRKRLWLGLRAAFLAITFVWLGLVVGGQLSVVQVAAFLNALISGFRWETFLVEPVIFTLWSFVALGLLFWGRGVYCGWLCPFGAAQELANLAARKLGVRQIAVPHGLHERLWLIKYTLFVAIIALSFYSMQEALVLAEAEPFKTAITMRMLRSWPLVLFALAVFLPTIFIERFYCRYLCALGAGLAIPAKLRIFDWLERRPQCGRECRLCEQKCTMAAIDPIGRINPNECVLCLRCQVIYHDPETCVVLKRRRRSAPAREGAEA